MRTASLSATLGSALTAAWILAATPSLRSTDFIRGDTNSDGEVSVADSHFLLSWLFRGFAAPECLDAADVDDSGNPDLSDAVRLLNFLVLDGPAPSAPFPEVGPDPTDGEGIDCAAIGGGANVADPEASLSVADSVASGGGNGEAVITLALSSSLPLGGYGGAIELPAGLVSGARQSLRDLLEFDQEVRGFSGADLDGDVIHFGYVADLVHPVSIAPGPSRAVGRITVCLAQGTPAGEYPLSLVSGELVDYDSGQVIRPELASGTLRVLSDVTVVQECTTPTPPPPPAFNCEFRLQDVVAPPGGSATVPFVIHADGGVQAYSFSLDFDEDVLQVTEVEPVWMKPAGTDPDYGFAIYRFNNRSEVPGNAGVDEGFVIGAAVFDLIEPVVMPPDVDNEALRVHFDVGTEAPELETRIRFLDGGQAGGQPVRNVVTAFGATYTPEVADSFLFVDCVFHVLPDITTFVRGDSNGDEVVDLSDAQTSLSYLFVGEGRPACFDASDANDDGRLDIADPIRTLQFLFLGGAQLPAPYPAAGTDPTADPLGCFFTF
jgi:hypothetical protein